MRCVSFAALVRVQKGTYNYSGEWNVQCTRLTAVAQRLDFVGADRRRAIGNIALEWADIELPLVALVSSTRHRL